MQATDAARKVGQAAIDLGDVEDRLRDQWVMFERAGYRVNVSLEHAPASDGFGLELRFALRSPPQADALLTDARLWLRQWVELHQKLGTCQVLHQNWFGGTVDALPLRLPGSERTL